MIKRSGKRRLCAVLAALMLLVSICCAGCGQNDVPVQEEDLIRVGFSAGGLGVGLADGQHSFHDQCAERRKRL